MREFDEFNNWATQIVNTTLFEKREENTIKREIPQTQDIVYQAQRRYPDRDADQALSLFLADKLEDFDRRDLEQNAVINSQRRENAKLNSNLSQLKQEFQNIEADSERTTTEIERLKTLSGRLGTGAERRAISADQIKRALDQIEELRNKPGMSEEKYQELKKKIETAQQNKEKIDAEEFKKFTNQLTTMQAEQTIEKDQLSRLGQIASKLETKREELASARGDLETRISDLEQREKEIPKIIEKEVEKETETLKKRQKEYRTRVQARSKQASTLIKNFLDQDLPTIDSRLGKIENELQAIKIGSESQSVEPEQPTIGPKSKSVSASSDYQGFMSQLDPNELISMDTEMSDKEISDIADKRWKELEQSIKNKNGVKTMGQVEKDEQLSEETKIHYGRRMLQLKKELMDLLAEPEFNRFRVINAAVIAEKNLYPLDKEYLQKNYSGVYQKVLAIIFYRYAKSLDFDEDELLDLAKYPKVVNKRLLKMLDEYVPRQRTLSVEESIDSMINNIIGEQVVRWIK